MATYGSMNEEKGPLVTFKDSHKIEMEESFDPNNPFDEKFDEYFWIKVKDLYNNGKSGIKHATAQRRVRVDRFKENCGEKDALVYLLTTIHDRYEEFCKRRNKFDLYPTFVFELSEFASVLLIDDVKETAEGDECAYEQLVECEDDLMKSPLHLAAERNLVKVAETIISLHPNIVYLTTMDDEYPLNLALNRKHDEVTSMLVDNMENERVRELFEDSPTQEAQFLFQDLVNDPNMKKTTLSILDCLMNPDWPFIPVNKDDEDSEEPVYSSFPNEPLRYHFYYTMLDGDGKGRDAKDDKGNLNKDFDHRSKSCLQLLADSAVAEEAMSHPVVRLLVRRKWEEYGASYMLRHFLFYIIFLLVMSLAFFLHSDPKQEPFKYNSAKDYVRLVCEIITLLFSFVYFLSELDQMEKERCNYFKDAYNYLDLLGLGLIIVLIPLRVAESPRVEWGLSSLAFIINFLRVFKYFPAFKTLGLYSKTFAKIIYADISKFFVVFSIVGLAFTGGVYLALKAAKSLDKVGGFWDVFLAEVRTLAESNGFADDYEGYSVLVIILIMVNMFCILIILVNILIGQISYRYEKALETANVQYDIDKTKLVTRVENSRFLSLNQRVKHYQRGAYISNEELENELLDDWVTFQKNSKSSEDRKETIKRVMSRKIKLISRDAIRKKEN